MATVRKYVPAAFLRLLGDFQMEKKWMTLIRSRNAHACRKLSTIACLNREPMAKEYHMTAPTEHNKATSLSR